jgi:exodeoxyribonuclease VII large subunit
VVRDILQILERRFPGLHLRLYPVLVQGEGSVEGVCRAIDYFSRSGWPDVIIIARGGGSLEDLWTFNEERVARAIAGSEAPVISAIGHETDFTIADFVADLRAPTPSAAAELVICTRDDLLKQLSAGEQKLTQAARYRIAMAARRLHQQGMDRMTATLHRWIGRRQQRIDELEYGLRERIRAEAARRRRRLETVTERLRRQDVRLRLADARRRIEAARSALQHRMRLNTTRAQGRLDPLRAHLTQLSPLKILDRGYAIVTAENGSIVKSAEQTPAGAEIAVRLAQGALSAKVTRSEP